MVTNKYKSYTRKEHIKDLKLEEYATPYPQYQKDEERKITEKFCDSRNAFIRDRDRILHSENFRKLQGKTQIFFPEKSPIIRNRLTHTLEVWQISVSIARLLKANKHLTEAIALGHDLGHTPFGHSGEAALNRIMIDEGLEGFSHNEQSVRVVSLLESEPNITPFWEKTEIPSWPNSVGLNLTKSTREGLFKHTDRFINSCKNKNFYIEFGNTYGSIEAQIVSIADDIAQHTHDLHDIWMAGAIGREDIMAILAEYPDFFGGFFRGKKADISPIIGNLIGDVVETSLINLNEKFNNNLINEKFITYSSEGQKFSENLELLIKEKVILGDEVNQMNSRGRHIIHSVFELFINDPYCLPNHIKKRFVNELNNKLKDVGEYEKVSVKYHENKKIVCDYIASLTDQEAIDIFHSMLV